MDGAQVERLIAGERQLFELRGQFRTGQKSQLDGRVAQLQKEIEGLTGQAAAVADDRIAAVGNLCEAAREREVDASGKVIAAGFIDTHTHDDHALLIEGLMEAKLTQGVTTVVTGNCGISLAALQRKEPPPAPLNLIGDAAAFYPTFRAYLGALRRQPPLVNAALMVGHSTLRVGSMADWGQPASADEIATMREKLGEALDAGVVGFSTGLFYPPGRTAPIPEVVALAELLAGTGAVYTTHMRDEGDAIDEAIEESLETARRAGVPLVISHHKCVGRRNFGRSRRTLGKVEQARPDPGSNARCLSLRYPYAASSTVLLPEFVSEGVQITVAWSEPHPELVGRDLGDIAGMWRCDLKPAAMRLEPAGGDLSRHGRGRRAADPRLSSQHGSLRWIAARRAPAPTALGHVSARSRALRARDRWASSPSTPIATRTSSRADSASASASPVPWP